MVYCNISAILVAIIIKLKYLKKKQILHKNTINILHKYINKYNK